MFASKLGAEPENYRKSVSCVHWGAGAALTRPSKVAERVAGNRQPRDTVPDQQKSGKNEETLFVLPELGGQSLAR
jgi:hypothetical protein